MIKYFDSYKYSKFNNVERTIFMAQTQTRRYYQNENIPNRIPITSEENNNSLSDSTTQQDNITNTPKSSSTPFRPEPANPSGPLMYNASDETFFPKDSQGQIVVNASTARQTSPVPEAAVIIYKNENGSKRVVAFSATDRDGKTQVITVPAPAKNDAQSPSDSLPFADYDISVRHPMFYTAIRNNVQVFGDELTILNIDMIPLPEFVNERNITQTVSIPKQNL